MALHPASGNRAWLNNRNPSFKTVSTTAAPDSALLPAPTNRPIRAGAFPLVRPVVGTGRRASFRRGTIQASPGPSITMPCWPTAALLLSSCLVFSLFGAEVPAEDRPKSGGTFSLYLENDSFVGTDRNYTSGVKLGWSSADLSKFSDTAASRPFLPVLDVVPFINEPAFQKNLVLALGQNIYTPNDTQTATLITDDRPYAGWLYLGVGVVWKNATVRNSIVFDLGVVGSWSFAQEAQRAVHDALKSGHPEGWDNQLHNEFGIVGTYERTWRWPKHERRSGLDWELLPHVGAALGNVATYANVGAELRFGLNLPDDFGNPAISPSAVTSTPVDGTMAAGRSRADFGVHLFARADGRAVAHNIFLDGNTFGDSHSVDRKIFVADLSAGIVTNYRNTGIAFAVVYRTKEFDGQETGQVFGTISLNVTY
jgi:lipid A 3-O-deacylase